MSQGLGINKYTSTAGFYSDVVECLPVGPATWVRFPAGAGWIFSPYDRISCKSFKKISNKHKS